MKGAFVQALSGLIVSLVLDFMPDTRANTCVCVLMLIRRDLAFYVRVLHVIEMTLCARGEASRACVCVTNVCFCSVWDGWKGCMK